MGSVAWVVSFLSKSGRSKNQVDRIVTDEDVQVEESFE